MARQQRGAALVMALLMLSVASIVGVASMRSSHLIESSSGNHRAMVEAQMSAEGAAAEAFMKWKTRPEEVVINPVAQGDTFSNWSDFDELAFAEKSSGKISRRYAYIEIGVDGSLERAFGQYIISIGAVMSGEQAVSYSDVNFVKIFGLGAANFWGGLDVDSITTTSNASFNGGGAYVAPSVTFTNASAALETALMDGMWRHSMPDGVGVTRGPVTTQQAAALHKIYTEYREADCHLPYVLFIPSIDPEKMECAFTGGGTFEGLVVITDGDFHLAGIEEVIGSVIVTNLSDAIQAGEAWLPSSFISIDNANLEAEAHVSYDQSALNLAMNGLDDAENALLSQGGLSIISWQ